MQQARAGSVPGAVEGAPNELFRTVREIADQKVPLLPAPDLERLDPRLERGPPVRVAPLPLPRRPVPLFPIRTREARESGRARKKRRSLWPRVGLPNPGSSALRAEALRACSRPTRADAETSSIARAHGLGHGTVRAHAGWRISAPARQRRDDPGLLWPVFPRPITEMHTVAQRVGEPAVEIFVREEDVRLEEGAAHLLQRRLTAQKRDQLLGLQIRKHEGIVDRADATFVVPGPRSPDRPPQFPGALFVISTRKKPLGVSTSRSASLIDPSSAMNSTFDQASPLTRPLGWPGGSSTRAHRRQRHPERVAKRGAREGCPAGATPHRTFLSAGNWGSSGSLA